METPKRKKKPLKGKGGYVMLALLVAMGGFIWYDRLHGRPQEPNAAPTVTTFTELRPESVTRVEVRGGEKPFTMEKRGETWSITAPMRVAADKEDVEQAIKSLLEATVSEGQWTRDRIRGAKLKEYGLDKPLVEILLNGGERVIQVGSQARLNAGFHAREKRDERVFVLASHAAETFKGKKPDDFREKSVLPIQEAEKIRAVRLESAKGRFALERRGQDQWQLTQPTAAPADATEVQFLLSQAKDGRAQSFVEGGGQDLPKYGLDKPRLTLTVTDERGQHTLLVGKDNGEKEPKFYALRQGEADVMVIEKSTFESLDKSALDLRSRKLLDFDTAKAERIALQSPNGALELQKRGEEWSLTKPVASPADKSKVETLLSSLSSSAMKFVEENPTDLVKYGLQAPPVRATVHAAGKPAQTLLVGSLVRAADKNAGKSYYAKTGKGPAVYEIAEYVYEDLTQKVDGLKTK